MNSTKIGLLRMHLEDAERRAFLPDFVARLQRRGAFVTLEHGYGASLGLGEEDYTRLAPGARFASFEETAQQDYVMVLRCPPDDEIRQIRSGACLISMLHFPTRPQRVDFLRSLGLEAISLDSLKDDSGRRLVENLRAVAWNGMETAFKVLRELYPSPGFESLQRPPLRVTLMGAGAVGSHVMQAAARYADPALQTRYASQGIPGVQVTVVDYDLTGHERAMAKILAETDILVDATQRPDPTRPVIPNAWIGYLPQHAVLLDLSVDPYDCTHNPPFVKGIEGIPQGNLDQYRFAPDDPAYQLLPECVSRVHRRHAVSCYSWPGLRPKECMEVYGKQIQPILRTLIEKQGLQNINPTGRFFERAIARAQLSRWPMNGPA